MSEYFIRYPDSEDAKGPYNLEQLLSLSEAKRVKPETLYYEENKEVWVAVNTNEDLNDSLFPTDQKLSLRTKDSEDLDLLNKPEEETQKLTIEEILAAAEGETAETKNKTTKAKWKQRTIGYTILSLTITFALSAAGLIFLNMGDIMTLNPALILANPFLIISVVDAFITLCLALSVTTIYPIVRFRTALGLGFLALYFFSFGQPIMAALVSISMISTFINTFTTRAYVFLITGPGAVGGMAGFLFLYYMYLNPAVQG
jgi:hypothetical protein